jgi:hypothetical protein
MPNLPVVYPIFAPPHSPERSVCPRIYKYYLYNALLFIEDSDIIVCSNSLSVRDFIRGLPAMLKRRVHFAHFTPREIKSLFNELYKVPCDNKSMALVTVIPKMIPFFRLRLKEYLHLDMDTLVVRKLSVGAFGKPGAPLSIAHVLEPWPNSDIHDFLVDVLQDRTPLQILEDHRHLSWLNTGIYRISPPLLKDLVKEEIFPLYLYVLRNFPQVFNRLKPMNDGDELIFRILLLFLAAEEVGKASVRYNYMPQWLKGVACNLEEAEIIHYSGPIKLWLYQIQFLEDCKFPVEEMKNDFDNDIKVAAIIRFFRERRQYLDDILKSEPHNGF